MKDFLNILDYYTLLLLVYLRQIIFYYFFIYFIESLIMHIDCFLLSAIFYYLYFESNKSYNRNCMCVYVFKINIRGLDR